MNDNDGLYPDYNDIPPDYSDYSNDNDNRVQKFNKSKFPQKDSNFDLKIPQAFDAEQALLGGIMLDNKRWGDIEEHVNHGDFYFQEHSFIFKAMTELAKESKPIDQITVEQQLKFLGKNEAVGGFKYLVNLVQNTPTAVNCETYAHIIREKAVLRELISSANDITKISYENKESIENILDQAERKIFDIAEKRMTKGQGPVDVSSIINATVDKIEDLAKNGSHRTVTGISTGFKDLDEKTLGLQKSDLIIIAARPSMGKTTFAMNLCENIALDNTNEQRKPVLVFSLEMPTEQILLRMMASLSRVDQTKIRTGRGLNDNDFNRLSATRSQIQRYAKLYVDDSSSLTPNEVRAKARRLYREHGGLSMIMIDYLQLMTSPSANENRNLEIADISRSLKALAKELEVPVVALSQLNRTLEKRDEKRPINSDLRESGSIEQDADLIMFIYRDEVYNNASQEKGVAEIIIGKQRNGPIGTVKLKFSGQYSKFEDLEHATASEYY